MPSPGGLACALGVAAGAALAWGLVEAQRVERRVLDVRVPRLPPELDGFRILHLSDLHLGSLSLNGLALEKAVRFAERAEVDLVALTGDLLARRRGEPALRAALGRLRTRHGIAAVLGNVDVAVTRDPFSEGAAVEDLGRSDAVLLRGSSLSLEVAGRRVQVAGAHPLAARGRSWPAPDPTADLRLLLAHYPTAVDELPAGAFDLVLAGHTHDGQICIPYPGGKLRLGELGAPYPRGTFELPATTLVVSRGVGTTFVPFRLFARPEAAVLVLRRRA